MPIGADAVTPAIPETQSNPGQEGSTHGDQMQFSGLGQNPAQNIEENQGCVEEEEENIQEL